MLEIEGLWKLYNLPEGASSSSPSAQATAGPKSKNDALVQQGRAFWALRDIDLAIRKGEVVGLIGANGAGKSTLLKILSRVTPPTHGTVRIYGSMVSLLEVGTGFHDELTGRENIRLNATMLGMRPEEIDHTFDQIVEFSGLGHFVDVPVKHLSSGMRVRLGFSVAVHVDPDILIIDEVLSVGDAEFRQRCRRRINDLMGSRDRTVIVVSHSMADLDALCSRVVLLEAGAIAFDGSPDTAIQEYLGRIKSDVSIQFEKSLKGAADGPPAILSTSQRNVPILDRENGWNLRNRTDFTGSGLLRFDTLSFCDANGKRVSQVAPLDALTVKLAYTANSDIVGWRPCAVNISFSTDTGERLFSLPSRFLTNGRANIAEQGEFVWTIPELPLLPGTYMIDAWCNIDGVLAFKLKWAAMLKVNGGSRSYQNTRHGHVLVKYDWSDGTNGPSEDYRKRQPKRSS